MEEEALTAAVLVRSWLERCRRELGGEERILCSRRDNARRKSIARSSPGFIFGDIFCAIMGFEM